MCFLPLNFEPVDGYSWNLVCTTSRWRLAFNILTSIITSRYPMKFPRPEFYYSQCNILPWMLCYNRFFKLLNFSKIGLLSEGRFEVATVRFQFKMNHFCLLTGYINGAEPLFRKLYQYLFSTPYIFQLCLTCTFRKRILLLYSGYLLLLLWSGSSRFRFSDSYIF